MKLTGLLAGKMLLALSSATRLPVGEQVPEPQAERWHPAPIATEITLWPKKYKLALPKTDAPESVVTSERLIGGRTFRAVRNVARPTLSFYPARGKNSGVTILVFPGGGYDALAIDLEGSEVCDWANARGINCAVLKYRVPHSGPQWNGACKCQVFPKVPMALQDAQRALRLTRAHAAEWNIDPHKLGVLGFSAGGHLVAAVSTHFGASAYPAADAADTESSRPDFAVALYPGHLFWGKDSWRENALPLNPYIADHVSAQTPPTFLLQNEDDRIDTVFDSLAYYAELRRKGAKVELHSYATGGHAFGLRRTAEAATEWPALVERWLVTIGMLGA